MAGYQFWIASTGTWSDLQTSGQYKFTGLSPNTDYQVKVRALDRVGNVTEETLTVKTFSQAPSLTLSSYSGKVLTGNSVNVTIGGQNYGTLSCSTANGSIATATLSENTLTVTGVSTANGTQSTTITVTGSNGVSAIYTIQSHKHYGSSTSGGGCYIAQTGYNTCTGTRNAVTCGGSKTGIACGGELTLSACGCSSYAYSTKKCTGMMILISSTSGSNYQCDTCGATNFQLSIGPSSYKCSSNVPLSVCLICGMDRGF